jgi:hypothetical protein
LHISSIFYTSRFRKLIQNLKKSGAFREAPLYELDKGVLLAAAPLYTIIPFEYFTRGHISPSLFLTLILIFIVLSFRDIRYKINKVIIPCTIGTLEPITITVTPTYRVIVLMMKAWVFYYRFDARKKTYSSVFGGRFDKEYKSPLMSKKEFNPQDFLTGANKAFVDPENNENCCPYVEAIVQKYRMSSVPIKMEKE